MVSHRGLELRIVCQRCGSPKIVPVLWGHPSFEMKLLEFQEMVNIGGCLVTSTGAGMPLWSCADCGEWVKDERFYSQETETFPMRVYYQQVNRLFDELEGVSDAEFSALRGRWFLKGKIRIGFKDAAATQLVLRRLPDGFELEHDGKEISVQNAAGFLTPNVFDSMLAFITQNSLSKESPAEAKLTVRIDREERDFRISIQRLPLESPPAIVVRLVDE